MDDNATYYESDHLEEVTADRMNSEPMILRGCTSSELVALVAVAIIIWLPLSVGIAWMLDAIPMTMGIAGIGILFTVFIAATLFQRIKRGRPDGYYQQTIALWLHAKRWRRSKFCAPDGLMSLGRTMVRS